MKVENKTVVITGGSGGFGKELAKRLVKGGANVCLGDIDKEAGLHTIHELNTIRPDSAVFSVCNVTHKQDLVRLIALAVAKFGSLDVIVNNAGIAGGTYQEFFEDEKDAWKAVIDIDLTAVIMGSQLAIKQFFKQGGNDYCIINTASLAGLVPTPFTPIYGAAKSGVVNFSRSLGESLRDHGIRVNAICPSFAPTAMTEPIKKGIQDWISVEIVIDAFMMAIEDDSIQSDVLRITPKYGIDFPTRRKVRSKM